MKNSQSLLLISQLVFSTLSILTLISVAEAGNGAKFGTTRDPQTCDDRTAPARGAISAAQAAHYVACERESADGMTLYLIDQLKVQVGASRPFQFSDEYNSEIDRNQPVYPLRGSYVTYMCYVPSSAAGTVGKNCQSYANPKATGVCYKTTFGDWRCDMADGTASAIASGRDIPPPP